MFALKICSISPRKKFARSFLNFHLSKLSSIFFIETGKFGFTWGIAVQWGTNDSKFWLTFLSIRYFPEYQILS
jgi:hypothetical protein